MLEVSCGSGASPFVTIWLLLQGQYLQLRSKLTDQGTAQIAILQNLVAQEEIEWQKLRTDVEKLQIEQEIKVRQHFDQLQRIQAQIVQTEQVSAGLSFEHLKIGILHKLWSSCR